MEIAAVPELDATVADHTLPDGVDTAATKVMGVRDWAQAGSRPSDWSGSAADAAEHRMTSFADAGDGVVLRLRSAVMALGDYVDAVVALRTSRSDLVTWRASVVAARQEFLRDAQHDPLMQDPVISGLRAQEVKDLILDYHLAVSDWQTSYESAQSDLRTALGQSLPSTPDHLVGRASSYLTPSEVDQLLLDLQLSPNDPAALAQLDLLIEQYGDDAAAWDALYTHLGPEGASALQNVLATSYEVAGDPEILARAEALRAGLALATSRWSDSENAEFAQELIDMAANDPYSVPGIAVLLAPPPDGAPALDGEFALAAADAMYELETGEPPVRITADHDTRLYYDMVGADVNRVGFTWTIDLAGPVLASLAESPEHALEHLSHLGKSDHWMNVHWWDQDGWDGVTRVWDAALQAPGGVVYPPPADGPAYDPLVSAAQARLMSEFFAGFGEPLMMAEGLTDEAMESLGNISARASTFASWVATEQTGTSDEHLFLGLEEYAGAYLPTFSDEDLARVLGIGIEDERFTEVYSAGTGQFTADVLLGIEEGRIDGMDGMKSVVTLTALVDGMNERIGIEAGAGQDAFADGVGLVIDAGSYLPGGAGTAFEVGGWAMTGAEYLGIVGDAEGQARAASLDNLIDHLIEVEQAAGGEYTADEIEDLRRFYSEQYTSLIILPG